MRAQRLEPEASIQPFPMIQPGMDWDDKGAPDIEWLVDGCFLPGTVAMLSGDGGLGKSLLLQQLCTAAAIGSDWLGFRTTECRSLAFFCEDDQGELQRRQERINRYYGCTMRDLNQNVTFLPRVGMDNTLINFDRKSDAQSCSVVFTQLKRAIRTIKPKLLILDTVADVFSGSEIVRHQVRQFITTLRQVAMEMDGTIILSAHPSNSGMASGSGISGSTAWNNSVRSRLYLTKGSEDDDNDTRYLKTMKNNQGPYGGKIKLRWQNGVIIPDMPKPMTREEMRELDGKMIKILERELKVNTRVYAAPNKRTSLVALASKYPQMIKYRYPELVDSQDRLIDSGVIYVSKEGRDSRFDPSLMFTSP